MARCTLRALRPDALRRPHIRGLSTLVGAAARVSRVAHFGEASAGDEVPEGLAVVRNVRPKQGDDAAAWIKQQMEEYYSKRSVALEYRSSAAWSLRQLDDRFSFLQPNSVVVDLGAFPGGWSQVAVERSMASSSGDSRVIGVDKVRMDPLRNHTFLLGDIAEESTCDKLLRALDGVRADVVLADVAPDLVGLKHEDHFASMEVCLHASKIMERTLKLGGWFVLRMYYGQETHRLKIYLKSRFDVVRSIRPPASRQVYREMFCVCLGFQGRAPIAEEVPKPSSFTTKREGHDRWEVRGSRS